MAAALGAAQQSFESAGDRPSADKALAELDAAKLLFDVQFHELH
jgi:hypothetical protein